VNGSERERARRGFPGVVMLRLMGGARRGTWHSSYVCLTRVQHSKPGYFGFRPGNSGPGKPGGFGLKSGHSGNQTKVILKLFDDAHDDMIYSQISLGML